MPSTRVATLLQRYQPCRSTRSVEVSAGLPPGGLTCWLDPAAARPDEPASVTVMFAVAATLGATISVTSRAFLGTWYDYNGWQWSHFTPGDRVVVFGPPDQQTGARSSQRGTVTEVDPLDVIEVRFDDGTRHHRDPDTDGCISHLSGGCQCTRPV